MFGASTKQKLNTKSSTECELVAADDSMPQVLWTNLFMEHQGYKPKETEFNQDNMNTMQLEKNGKASSGKRTRHINIRYFFITDRIANGDLVVRYCPTGDMIADFFTKPLQGTLFRYLRNKVMNINDDDNNSGNDNGDD